MTIAPAPGPEQGEPPRRPLPRGLWLACALALCAGALGLWFGLVRRPGEAASEQASSQAGPQALSVRVRVHSAEGPTAGAAVRITSEGEATTSDETDVLGEARLSAPPGRLRIEVNARGHARTLVHADLRAPATVEVALEPERVLEGTVLDDLGEPLADAAVHVLSLDAADMEGWDARTGADGKFRVGGLPRHALSLEVTREGHEGHERTLGEGYDDEPMVVLARQGELLVTVHDEHGAAVTDAELLVTGTGLWPAAQARSDAQGTYLFTGLSTGEYRARAHRGARAAAPSSAVQVVPGERAELTLLLEPGARVCGKVLDARGDMPLAGAEVTLLDATPGIPGRITRAGEDGSFELVGLWPGAARLEIGHAGFAPFAEDLTLAVNAPCAARRLAGAAALSGSVVDEAGRPVAGALVSVSTREGLPVTFREGAAANLSAAGELGVTHGPVPRIPLNAPTAFAMGALAGQSADDGSFRIEGLAPSPVALHVARAGYAPTTLEIDQLAPHETRGELRAVLRAAGRVEGRVLDGRGAGVPGVYLSARGTSLELSAISDAEGHFVLADVLGDVSVEATASGYAPVACHVQVNAGAVARCTLTLDGSLHELAVRVEDERGQPLAGALVSVQAASTTRAAARVTGEDGAALVRELPEPPYLVDVTLEGYLPVRKQRVERIGRELRVGLARSASIAGVVLDAIGRPVRGALVSTDEGDATSETGADGTFTLRGVFPGALFVWARHKTAGEGESAELRARPGERADGVRIVLAGRYEASGDDLPEAPRAPATAAEPPPPEVNVPVAAPRPPARPQPLTLDQRGPSVVVASVASGSAGEKAGLQPGDVLVTIDGETVFSAAQARGMLRDPAGTTAQVRLVRGGRSLSLRFRRASL